MQKLSLKLVKILRHDARDQGLEIDSEGFVEVRRLLRCDGFKGSAFKDIEQ
jgi:RNA:NAD 2'-phosphotransferase (TPT1/KptA family)